MRPGSAETISLTGMMGSGKSTVAAGLARLLGRRLVDTDLEVERRAGRPVAAIFAERGEGAFRAIEREVVRGISGPVVVACANGLRGFSNWLGRQAPGISRARRSATPL